MMFMAHDPPYAAAHIEARGYAKVKDTIAYLCDADNELPRVARLRIDASRPASLIVRTLDTSRYYEEFDTITEVFNDAWSRNWGFVPFTRAEIRHMAKSLRPMLHPSCVAMAELHGEVIAFGILLPNLNEAIADFDGRLLPFNWLKLLLRLKRGTRTGRVPLMGIRRRHTGGVVGGIIAFLMIDQLRKAAQARGMRQIELSWILEDNRPMRHIIEVLGGVPYKTYRIYEKALG